MPGLVPGIHAFVSSIRRGWHRNSGLLELRIKTWRKSGNRTCGDKPGHDECNRFLNPGVQAAKISRAAKTNLFCGDV
jgi:hypothetical protein